MDQSAKRKIRWSTVLAGALLLVAVVALAAQTLGYVNWKGDFTPAAIVENTPPPETGAEGMSDFDAIEALLADIPDGEFWNVRHEHGGTGTYGFIGPRLTTMEELASQMEGLPLLLPAIPDGYTVRSVELSYVREALLPDMDAPYETQRHGDMTLSKYRLNAVTRDDIMGYNVVLTHADGYKLAIDAYFLPREQYEEPEDGEFLVDEGQTFEVLTVAGFAHALAITRENGARDIRLQQEIDGTWIANYYVYMQADVDIGALFVK